MGNEQMTTQKVRVAIDELTVRVGEKKGIYHIATFSCKDVLDYINSKNTPNSLRHVAYIVTREYPDSILERGSGDSGWVLNIRTRTV